MHPSSSSPPLSPAAPHAMPPSKTYPAKSAGPYFPIAPITNSLLRVIPGHPRFAIPALRWLSAAPPSAPLSLHAVLASSAATIPLPTAHPTSAAWFDFDFSLLAHSYIIFSLVHTEPAPHHPPFVARAFLLPEDFAACAGVLHRPMLDPSGTPLVCLTLDFLLVKTCPHRALQPVHRASVPRFTGHRGLGPSGPAAPRRPSENTMQSFLAAALSPSPPAAVELDVQLSHDGHAVVIHDWFFRPGGERDTDAHAASALKVPVYSLTLDQLDKLYRERCARMITTTPELSQMRSALEDAVEAREDVKLAGLEERIWTLKEVCETLPQEVGLLVEVKYPALNVQEDMGGIPYPEKNHYIDVVLGDLFQVARNVCREISFLTFDPDLCVLLSLKQSVFPVYMSHCETLDKPCDEFDPRCIDLDEGLRFALSQKLDGMMLYNKLVELKSEGVQRVLDKGLRVITYGGSNCDPEVVKRQFEMGIGGIIADDVNVLIEQLGS